jgi:transposase-like protein
LALDRNELKKLLKEKGRFNAFMREVSKEVVVTLLGAELTNHLGF